jgi:hypothetical protein
MVLFSGVLCRSIGVAASGEILGYFETVYNAHRNGENGPLIAPIGGHRPSRGILEKRGRAREAVMQYRRLLGMRKMKRDL